MSGMTVLPAEWYITLGLRPGMHVHDGSGRAPEHIVDHVDPAGPGLWDVTYADGGHAVVGARHSWLVVGAP